MRVYGRWRLVLVTGSMIGAAMLTATSLGTGIASAAENPEFASLKVTTSVSNYPITPDPGANAFVKFTLTARNSDGKPAANATVRMSNAKPGSIFHTNAKGVLTLIEPVSVQPGSVGGTKRVTARVTAADEATGSATQELYDASQYGSCSFDGKPGLDTSLLDEMLPDEFSISAIQTLIENFGPVLGGYHTSVAGYTVTVPKASTIYAQTLLITHRSKTTYSGTGYSRHQILQVGDLLDQIQTGCTSGSGDLALCATHPGAGPGPAARIYDAYMSCLAARGVGNKTFESGARTFLARFPDPQAWAVQPLAARLAGTRPHLQPLLNFLMLHRYLRPGYDYLLERKLTVILREAAASPPGGDLQRFAAAAEALGYSLRARTGMASEVAVRVLIQAGRPLDELTDTDFTAFGRAISEREARIGQARPGRAPRP